MKKLLKRNHSNQESESVIYVNLLVLFNSLILSLTHSLCVFSYRSGERTSFLWMQTGWELVKLGTLRSFIVNNPMWSVHSVLLLFWFRFFAFVFVSIDVSKAAKHSSFFLNIGISGFSAWSVYFDTSTKIQINIDFFHGAAWQNKNIPVNKEKCLKWKKKQLKVIWAFCCDSTRKKTIVHLSVNVCVCASESACCQWAHLMCNSCECVRCISMHWYVNLKTHEYAHSQCDCD